MLRLSKHGGGVFNGLLNTPRGHRVRRNNSVANRHRCNRECEEEDEVATDRRNPRILQQQALERMDRVGEGVGPLKSPASKRGRPWRG